MGIPAGPNGGDASAGFPYLPVEIGIFEKK